MSGPAFLLLPAYNEEAHIENMLNLVARLQRKSAIGHILIVDDGSTDKTSEIAKRVCKALSLDARIIMFKQNHGKGAVLFEGIQYFFSRCRGKPKDEKLITLDSDLKKLDRKSVENLCAMLGEVRKKTILKGKMMPPKEVTYTTGMCVGQVMDNVFIEFSGQRAFLLRTLKPFLIRPYLRKRLIEARYGLELLLNEFFKDRLLFVKPPKFKCEAHWAHSAGRIGAEMNIQSGLILNRWADRREAHVHRRSNTEGKNLISKKRDNNFVRRPKKIVIR